MIDKIFVRPFLALFTFVKRNPLLATFLIVLLFLLPPLAFSLYVITSKIIDFVRTVAGVKAAEAVARVCNTVLNWLANHSYACPVFALAIGVFNPVIGGLLTVWCLVDKLKTGPSVSVLPAPEPPPPEIIPDTDYTGDIFDDYWGAQA